MAKEKRVSVHFDRVNNEFVGMTQAVKKQLKDTFKGLDVDNELVKMSIWLLSDKGKDLKGTIGFIVNWLKRVNPSSLTTTQGLDLIKSDTPLGDLMKDYLKDLWEHREHILEFNTLSKI